MSYRTANGGTHISAWSFCDQCGLPYHLVDMQMQNGFLVCFSTCYENPDSWAREGIIKQVLQDVGNEMNNMTALKRSEGTNDNVWDETI